MTLALWSYEVSRNRPWTFDIVSYGKYQVLQTVINCMYLRTRYRALENRPKDYSQTDILSHSISDCMRIFTILILG